MTLESGATDSQRLRAGYAVLSIGVMILLFAWGMAALRMPESESDVAVRHQKLEPPSPDSILPAIGAGMVLCGICLIVVLAISIIAFLRISHRYRDHILAPPSKPTASADVWSMHKPPEQ